MSDEIQVCPNCDSSDIQINNIGSTRGTSARTQHYCRGCQTGFDEPSMRPRKGSSNLSGLARRLYRADSPGHPYLDEADE